MIENMGMPNGMGWNEPDDSLGDSVQDTFGGSILMDDSDGETNIIASKRFFFFFYCHKKNNAR